MALAAMIPGGGAWRTLRAGSCAEVRILDQATGEDRLVLRADHMLEAPDWAPDGEALYVNGGGRIALLPLAGEPALHWIAIDGIDSANNDHLVSADGQTLFLTSDGAIHAVAATGGTPRRLTPEGSTRYYLHGLSPDGATLACAIIDRAIEGTGRGIRLVPASGGAGTLLIGGTAPLDGPEWTPDGAWIWFNGEIGARVPGHARLFRIRPDGSGLQQMTDTDAVDWFPHVSPDGRQVAFLRYPPGTEGHPADLPVRIMLMEAAGGPARTIATLTGGQGTINVGSWSPDGRLIAYVAYPDRD